MKGAGTVAGMVAQFGKDYKDPHIARIGLAHTPIPRISTRHFSLDLALGGGFPEGRCSVIYGTESAMKTTLLLNLIVSAQEKYPDKVAAFVDIEGHLDSGWAKQMGVDLDRLAYISPPTAEHFVDMTESLLYAEDLSLIGVDSLAALTTTHELNSEAEKAMVGTQGILINKFYRKVSRAMSKAKREGLHPTMICINQIREKVGVMYGSPETMPGGRSFKYASSLTLRVSGKDEFSKEAPNVNLPAFKKISATVHKQKVGITNTNAEIMVALQPNAKNQLKVGESAYWKTMVARMKDYEMLVQSGKKKAWDVVLPDTGEVLTFKTQEALRLHVLEDHEFRDRLQGLIFQIALDPDNLIAHSDEEDDQGDE